MMRTLGRLIMVPLGFLLGLAAALTLLFWLGFERATHAMHGGELDLSRVGDLIGVFHGFVGLVSVATIVPALLVVIVGEVARIRSATYYVLGGGIALMALPLLARVGSLGKDLAQIGLVWQVFATAGFTGGLVYWLVAGRRA